MKKKASSKGKQNHKHTTVSDVAQSVKPSRRSSAAEKKERGSTPNLHSPWARSPPPLPSPSQEPRIIPFQGVLHHEEHSRHGNTVCYDPLPHTAVSAEGESPYTVEAMPSSQGSGRSGIVQSLNLFDLGTRHCVAPPPKDGMLITRKFLRRRKREKASQSFSFPPIEFKSEHFPETAFHYFSKADHTSCANDSAVFFHINRELSKDQTNSAHVVEVSPDSVFEPSESETDSGSGQEEEEEPIRPVPVPSSKPRIMIKLQSPAKKSLLKNPTLTPHPQLQPRPQQEGARIQPPAKAREKSQQSKAGALKGKSPCARKPPLAITQRDVHHLLTHPDAALSKINLRVSPCNLDMLSWGWSSMCLQ